MTTIWLMKGKSTVLILHEIYTGCGFASKNKFMFGRVSMKIKLIAGDSAGTVTAFYVCIHQFLKLVHLISSSVWVKHLIICAQMT